jgi:3',5'-cyclic-AMP phosphodiesterase
LGDFDNSDVILSDYALIEELRFWTEEGEFEKRKVRDALSRLGDQAAAQLEAKLVIAATDYASVIAATHVPPFREATWHEGRLPTTTGCRTLCGHTHSGGEVQPLKNLRVRTGPATYGAPEIQCVFEIA